MSTESMRAAFEAWITEDGRWNKAAKRSADGDYYVLMHVAAKWEAWKAAWQAALAQQTVSGAPDPVGQPAGKQTGPVLGAPTSQRADEPVAWGLPNPDDPSGRMLSTSVSQYSGWVPLYTSAPAAPAYVRLSKEDIDNIDQSMCGERECVVAFARHIESLVVARMRGEGK